TLMKGPPGPPSLSRCGGAELARVRNNQHGRAHHVAVRDHSDVEGATPHRPSRLPHAGSARAVSAGIAPRCVRPRGIYLFSMAFLEDIPRRLTGPGGFRFILQPSVAIFLGIRSGLATRGWGGRRISTASSSIETLGASC